MKLKLLILKIILILSYFSNNSFAKNLPPGSGISDVPAGTSDIPEPGGKFFAKLLFEK